MDPSFYLQTPKKSTSVSINGDLLSQANALKINLSDTLEQALIQELNSHKQRGHWQEENKYAIEAYNQLVEENGIFSCAMRTF
jgi:antitoxin CcdA